jgi:hypothetical protein
MPIYTATRGTVVGAPVPVSADTGGITVLALRDLRPGKPSKLEEPGVEFQVCIREPELSQRVLERVRLGDRLLVLGNLHLHAATEPLEDPLSAARVSLDAVTIGLDLDPKPT